ncbi:MAG: molybdenum cofactor guanylyltransferase [Zhongshania sp.]|uniref:molybdenum cofactor guanylyltransferase MobA n=1 Tax=Zhongshania sp. TaxID=1971902 RepID=UPI00262D6CF1|nr:molybdenum cofactor guanylyltransferase MobA [Zhongshania sp.]MDF1690992.1 molybdenum cofactor guanylyltransferase [Zhongshania sp.]
MAINEYRNYDPASITAVILAGGAGRRVNNQDKGLLQWHGAPLIEHVLTAVPAEIQHILISCNRNQEQYRHYANTVTDSISGFQGPLAGIYAALQAASTPYAFILPCDSPCPPPDLLAKLYQAHHKHHADITYANDGERGQYLFALLNTQLTNSLGDYLASGGRSVNQWYRQLNSVSADFSGQQHAFRNFNTVGDITPQA